MNTKFYLDFRGKASDGKGSLILILFKQGKSASIPLGIRLSKSEWSGTKIINRDDSSALNALINKKKSDIDKRLVLLELEDCFESMTVTEIKKAVDVKPSDKPKANTKSVEYLFKAYMDTDMEYGTREIYETTFSKVKKYAGNITIDKITYEWLVGFDKYLSKSQGVNGRGIYLRALRTICNFAVHIGVTDKYPFSMFQIKTEPTRKRCVPVEVLRKFLTVRTSKSEERFRDYFLLMFYLIGINAGDLLHLKEDALVGGRLEYIRAKTHKKYSIKLEPEALGLINKYHGKHYLLDAMDTCKSHKNFIHMMNRVLQQIGTAEEIEIPSDNLFEEPRTITKKTPMLPDITTYFSRHCWATYAYEIGIPIDVISQALGHSFGNRTTLIYIKYDQRAVDAANRRVIDYLWGAGEGNQNV